MFARCQAGRAVISSLVSVFKAGLDPAQTEFRKQYAQIAEARTKNLEEEEPWKLPMSREGFLQNGGVEKIVELATCNTVNDAKWGADAALVVFSHSMLDSALSDLCRISALISPRDWLPCVSKRKVDLCDVETGTFGDLLRRKLDEFLDELERDPLIKRADLLWARCHPEGSFNPIKGYKFDRNTIQELDRIRQGVVHGDLIGKLIPEAQEKSDYLISTAFFFGDMLSERYGLKLSYMHMLRYAATHREP